MFFHTKLNIISDNFWEISMVFRIKFHTSYKYYTTHRFKLKLLKDIYLTVISRDAKRGKKIINLGNLY